MSDAVLPHCEKVAIFKYLLRKIRIKDPGSERHGIVFKRPVNPRTCSFWHEFVDEHGETGFRASIDSLPSLTEFSVEEKADLYAALQIPVPEPLRQPFIDQFGVEFDERWLIVGAAQTGHWLCDDGPYYGLKRTLFTEKEDGLMWRHVLETAQRPDAPASLVHMSVWREFTKRYDAELPVCRRDACETYRHRFYQRLVPTLHRMPFDIETKLFLYAKMHKPVPGELRDEASRVTGVTLFPDGKIAQWVDRPARFELQSRRHESMIGITSSERVSSLGLPSFSTKPFSADEDRAIWLFLVDKFRDPTGRAQRAKSSYSGQVLWKSFKSATGSGRSWQVLAHHFENTLLPTIMSTELGLKTKLELHFSLRLAISPPVLVAFQTICSLLVLNTKLRFVQYAEGADATWRVGTRPHVAEHEFSYYHSDDVHVLKEEIDDDDEMSDQNHHPRNSILYPYFVKTTTRKRNRKRATKIEDGSENATKYSYFSHHLEKLLENRRKRDNNQISESSSDDLKSPKTEQKIRKIEPVPAFRTHSENSEMALESQRTSTPQIFEQNYPKPIETPHFEEREESSQLLDVLDVTPTPKRKTPEKHYMSAVDSIDESFSQVESAMREFLRRLRVHSGNIETRDRLAFDWKLEMLSRNFRTCSARTLVIRKRQFL